MTTVHAGSEAVESHHDSGSDRDSQTPAEQTPSEPASTDQPQASPDATSGQGAPAEAASGQQAPQDGTATSGQRVGTDARSSAGIGSHPGMVPATCDRVQLLDEQGQRRSHAQFDSWVADLDAQALQRMFTSMARARKVDEMATRLQRQGHMALWTPLRGQEAAQVGSALALAPEDFIFPSYREHAILLERGITVPELTSQFRGFTSSGWDPYRTNSQVFSLVLGSHVPHAVGWAMAQDQKRRLAEAAGQPPEPAAASVVYFGDGASTEGEVHEGMVFAASYDAPVVFFIQNNQWAISVPFSTQSRVPLAQRAAGYGFHGVRVDGNDPLAVLAVSRWAMEEARTGRGPVLIEAETYRQGAHTTADDPTKYRLDEEDAGWDGKDPLVRTRALMEREYGIEPSWFEELDASLSEWVREQRTAVLEDAPVDLDQRFDVAYCEPHPLVERERAWYHDYRESGAADSQDDA